MPPTVRDRTKEFFATVDSFQQLGHSSQTKRTNAPSPSKLSKQSIEQSSQIRNLANQIAETIEQVEQKIIELQQLAKLTSNFRDERPKIQSLMFNIKKDIDGLNINLKTLKTFLSQSFSNISSDHNIISYHKSLLNVLTTRYGQLAKSFSTACEISTKHLQRQKRQREKFGFGPNKKKSFRKVPLNRLQKRIIAKKNEYINTNDNLPKRDKSKSIQTGRMHQSVHRNRIRNRRTKNNMNNNGSTSETEALLASDSLVGHQLKNASQSQSQMLVYQESQYNEQRAVETEAIEGQLTEISQMMGKLAMIVDEQRQTIIQIGDNVDDSIQHVEGAIEQLQKYLSTLSGNRWLMIKIFALLIFLAIIFTIFIA
eukprot:395690_1